MHSSNRSAVKLIPLFGIHLLRLALRPIRERGPSRILNAPSCANRGVMSGASIGSVELISLDQPSRDRLNAVTVGLFTTTTFFGSALLFLLEPMFTKMILPTFGGSAAVWNTAMVFFQAALFLAYIYSHKVANRALQHSVVVHSLAVLAPLLVLPVAIRGAANVNIIVNHPAVAVLKIAVVSIGLPFFLVATSAPLLQKWFSQTPHRSASDPYFLYAASNAGSLIGLALYPCLLEPGFAIHQQVAIWSVGYCVFAALALSCGFAAYKRHLPDELAVSHELLEASPKLFDKLLWAALAFIPASLLTPSPRSFRLIFPPSHCCGLSHSAYTCSPSSWRFQALLHWLPLPDACFRRLLSRLW